MAEKIEMIGNAILEVGVYGIDVPMHSRDDLNMTAHLIVGGFEDACMEDVAAYWEGNFRSIGIIG